MTPVREALLLGLAHGPLELLPVSSSAHVAAIPSILGWQVADWSGAARKELEVALHAGTGAALGWLLVRGRLQVGGLYSPRRAPVLACALVTPALAGLALESAVEERLRGPAILALGLVAGAAGLAGADARPGRRRAAAAGWRDGIWLGLAQAAALVPGVSRSGATLTAARARGFDRVAASELSWGVGLPVLLGAGGLKTARVFAQGSWRARGPALAAALAGAAASTLVAAKWLGTSRRAPLWPWAAWRVGLAASILAVGDNADS